MSKVNFEVISSTISKHQSNKWSSKIFEIYYAGSCKIMKGKL